MNAATRAKWLRFVVLILGGGTIYKLANIKDAFYVPMQQAMGLTHTQIGTMLSINTIIARQLGRDVAKHWRPRSGRCPLRSRGSTACRHMCCRNRRDDGGSGPTRRNLTAFMGAEADRRSMARHAGPSTP